MMGSSRPPARIILGDDGLTGRFGLHDLRHFDHDECGSVCWDGACQFENGRILRFDDLELGNRGTQRGYVVHIQY